MGSDGHYALLVQLVDSLQVLLQRRVETLGYALMLPAGEAPRLKVWPGSC